MELFLAFIILLLLYINLRNDKISNFLKRDEDKE
jgi:hypothetical protein